MGAKDSLTFGRANLALAADKEDFLSLSRAYFNWMNGEISRRYGFSIPDIINTDLDSYVLYTADIGSSLMPDEGGIYFLRNSAGQPVAMGGLRRLPDGAAEIVRIYTEPESRGHGHGARMVQELTDLASKLGYNTLRLDTAVFMESAQRIYEAAGFVHRAPYPGAEPPEQLQPHWLYLERAL